jgi:mono/diheme cytochrome c family protein
MRVALLAARHRLGAGRWLALVALVIAPVFRPVQAEPPAMDEGMARAWRTLRAADCARCHGKDYDGLAAPSLVAFARTQSREAFVEIVLDGRPAMGMPAYRDNPRVVEGIDEIYRYLKR